MAPRKTKKATSETPGIFPVFNEGEHVKDGYRKALSIYNSLNIPEQYRTIPRILEDEDTYNMMLSIRAMGKTTDFLLWGLCLQMAYGILPVYIRQTKYNLEPKEMRTLFNVVRDRQYGYIEKITNGRYNWIDYRAGEWHYQKIDEDLNVVDICPIASCKCLSVDNAYLYKSTLNIPNGQYIIFDEILNPRGYLPDEFILFCDLLRTIIRTDTNTTTKIYMLGNLVDRNSVYFDEFQLNDIIADIKFDEHRHLNCDKTTFHLYMFPRAWEKMQSVNRHFFGWNSPKLNAITAKTGMWAMSNFPHPPKGNDFKTVCKRFIVKSGKTVGMELRKYDNFYYVVCRQYERCEIPDNAIYFIDTKNSTPTHRFKFGWTKTDKIFEQMFRIGLYTYVDNTTGTFVTNFYRDCEKIK